MNVEKIFRNIPDFQDIVLDVILFESKYPVMFTCKNGNDIYLFICCLSNADEMEWIGTKTTYENLIELLENKITIREAFLNVTENKIVISYNGREVARKIVNCRNIPENFLPTAGEYMDAEEDEYSDEIASFKKRVLNVEHIIRPRMSRFLAFQCTKLIWVADDYFSSDFDTEDLIQYKTEKIYGQQAVLA